AAVHRQRAPGHPPEEHVDVGHVGAQNQCRQTLAGLLLEPRLAERPAGQAMGEIIHRCRRGARWGARGSPSLAVPPAAVLRARQLRLVRPSPWAAPGSPCGNVRVPIGSWAVPPTVQLWPLASSRARLVSRPSRALAFCSTTAASNV